MNRDRPRLTHNASAQVIYPIAGLMGGLVLGGIWVWAQPSIDDLLGLHRVIQCAIWGFFLGMALALITSLAAHRVGVASTKRLITLVAVAAALCWFGSRVLVGLLTF